LTRHENAPTSRITRADAQSALSIGGRERWALLVIALAQLMIVLDLTVVGVALPTIQQQLDFSTADRQWVVTAYALTFAGLLLLFGRIADYLGRKLSFIAAMVGFGVSSIVGGFAINPQMLIGARAAQGLFGAMLAPALLALLTITFTTSRARATAFSVFGAVSGGGAAVGLIIGGVVTQYLGWRWGFFVNVPIVVIATVGALFAITESRVRAQARFDFLGALLATLSTAALVYAFNDAASVGWHAPLTIVLLGVGVALILLFLLVEARISAPMLPLVIVANRARGGAYLAMFVLGFGMFGASFFLTFYLQAVKFYSPLNTGLAFMPQVVGVLVASLITRKLVTRLPPRWLAGTGLLLEAAGITWLTQLDVSSGYAGHLLLALLLIGLGLGTVSPTVANLATSGVAVQQSGIASAALNTAQMIGVSLGTALLNTIAVSQTQEYLAARSQHSGIQLEALVHGYTVAIACGAAVLAIGAVVTVLVINSRSAGK